ncbi:ankyrin repeat domain-containing protein [Pseudomonas taiwanensis]|uniref:ankyrin repeat domain-containing protein n=1 Tax=Pseudomonas taiwanensis TaxID=470150 RepID=UPI0028DFE43E|nr:ankyrin repeat domain-containing protein [Pseudomonas taiwanensis]MDT8925277.1 ankyrin repeat domain-containing protein [Pseudomonas taiwanensis]
MSIEVAPLALEVATPSKRMVSANPRSAPEGLGSSHYPTYLDRFIENHPNPLSSACSRGDNVLLKLLLQHGVRPTQDTQDPLIIAAAMRNKPGVGLLLQHGANPNLSSRAGLRGAVHAAIGKDPQWAVQIRLNPVWRAEARRLPLAQLCENFERAERDIIRLLAHAGADLNNDLGGFETPLHVAILDSNIEMQALLLRLGADLDTPNYRGATARHLLGPELTRMLIDLANS